eukprot:scaffold325708_cov54-Tisochrysis_lutea.AAC.1
MLKGIQGYANVTLGCDRVGATGANPRGWRGHGQHGVKPGFPEAGRAPLLSEDVHSSLEPRVSSITNAGRPDFSHSTLGHRCDTVLVLLSDRYFHSPYCCLEMIAALSLRKKVGLTRPWRAAVHRGITRPTCSWCHLRAAR